MANPRPGVLLCLSPYVIKAPNCYSLEAIPLLELEAYMAELDLF